MSRRTLPPMLRRAPLTVLVVLAAGCPRSFSANDVAAEGPPDLDSAADRRAAGDRPQRREALIPDLLRWPDLPADRPLKQIEALTDQAMKTALYNLVKGQSGLSYTKAKSAMFVVADGGIDVHNGVVECIYTGRTAVADGTTAPGGFNAEHSWPQSEGADTAPAEGDLHHLFPCDASANSHRSSLTYGNTDCGGAGAAACKWQDGGSKIGAASGGIGTVFQVRPERRGDIARAHFYFSIRYQLAIPQDEEQALRGWNALDLPDDLERARNAAIITIQKKGNPFIDRPDFVEHIADF